jgi:hypothetical protein
MKLKSFSVVTFLLISMVSMSCRRSDYICDCQANVQSFQNVFFNATEREAEDLCEAAEIKFEPGNPGLQCEVYLKED